MSLMEISRSFLDIKDGSKGEEGCVLYQGEDTFSLVFVTFRVAIFIMFLLFLSPQTLPTATHIVERTFQFLPSTYE